MKDPLTRKYEIQNYFIPTVVGYFKENLNTLVKDPSAFQLLNELIRAIVNS